MKISVNSQKNILKSVLPHPKQKPKQKWKQNQPNHKNCIYHQKYQMQKIKTKELKNKIIEIQSQLKKVLKLYAQLKKDLQMQIKKTDKNYSQNSDHYNLNLNRKNKNPPHHRSQHKKYSKNILKIQKSPQKAISTQKQINSENKSKNNQKTRQIRSLTQIDEQRPVGRFRNVNLYKCYPCQDQYLIKSSKSKKKMKKSIQLNSQKNTQPLFNHKKLQIQIFYNKPKNQDQYDKILATLQISKSPKQRKSLRKKISTLKINNNTITPSQ